MRIFLGDVSASYASFKAILSELGDVKTIFYGLKATTTDVETAVALFHSRDYYVQIDFYNPGVTKPTQATFLTDFPSAVEAYVNSATY